MGLRGSPSRRAFLIVPFHIHPLQQREERSNLGRPVNSATDGTIRPVTCWPTRKTMLRTILLIVLVLLLLGALPTWPYSTGWGYYPSGGLGLVLLIVLVLVIAKKI